MSEYGGRWMTKRRRRKKECEGVSAKWWSGGATVPLRRESFINSANVLYQAACISPTSRHVMSRHYASRPLLTIHFISRRANLLVAYSYDFALLYITPSHLISRHLPLLHFLTLSRHFTSRHVKSCNVTWCNIMSLHYVAHQFVTFPVASDQVTSLHVIPRQSTLLRFTLRLTSRHVMSSHVTLSRFT